MDQSLLNSYRETTYSVPKLGIDIRLDQRNQRLEQFLAHSSNSSWAFITAWNPGSKLLSESENRERNKLLRKDLSSMEVYKGIGIPDEDDWAPEKSFFVLGISKNKADKLAKKYGQNAYLFGTTYSAVQLITIDD